MRTGPAIQISMSAPGRRSRGAALGWAGSAALALLTGAAGACASARQGTVVGSVALRPADLAIYEHQGPNPYVGRVGAVKTRRGADADTAFGVAYIADSTGVGTAPAAPALLDQIGERFEPRILAVVAGQTVTFRNSDNVYHNIFSYSPPKRFDLGRYPKGQSRSLPFRKTGAVQVYCDIHSHMRADILVVPSRLFAYVNAEGRFRIESVPSGTHTLVVWLPQGTERRSEVLVPEDGVVETQLAAP